MTTESDKKEGGDLEQRSVATESRDEDSSDPSNSHQQEDSQSYTNTNSVSASKSGMTDAAWNAIYRKYAGAKQEDEDEDEDMTESDLTDSQAV